MAKFTPGAIVSEISGKIAATVFSRNKGGAVIRNRRTPINRRSISQSKIRQGLGNLSSSWRGLSQVQRDSWNAAAPNFPYQNTLGETKYLSGQQMYVQFNQNRIIIAQAVSLTAPAPFAFSTITGILTATAVPALSIAFTTTPLPALNNLAVFATAPLSPGIGSPNASRFRYITNILAAAVSPANILVAYQAIFGNPVTGQKIFIELRPISTSGQGGTPLRFSAIVT